ncbi:GNAT family N-acetyltransferase [Montanilutibacter psychrotolerans]|uniref:GNAT family N-acetyltransferase n=1 Tax=Montanilutibacter psychrotolerans TaxID=1327343 RepID=A0A3M8T035_9GAMM|nr:GNAT family N-acetyltransferase [Lysobacter psychrotolerans]RNF86383.1 GNAT family N-acetyltransferase [Lysobacter psychrotolerans]
MPLTLRTYRGEAIAPHLHDLARLRIGVFRQWPNLYAGDVGYEADYLKTYLRTPRSVVVLAFDGDAVVGASTGLPLVDESAVFLASFKGSDVDPAQVFYCGESVLLPEYRGNGIGHRFFDARQAHAQSLGGFSWTAFCAVDRRDDDPRRPRHHRGNEAFWEKRGYVRHPGMQVTLPWREVGAAAETDHTLTFWLRPLESNV